MGGLGHPPARQRDPRQERGDIRVGGDVPRLTPVGLDEERLDHQPLEAHNAQGLVGTQCRGRGRNSTHRLED
jgi:hypothetical protein